MNPTEQSGNDLCEQPVLSWVDFRNLAGLGLIALVVLGIVGMSGSENSQPATEAAAASATITDSGIHQEATGFIFTAVPTEEQERITFPEPEVHMVN